jgi:predicted dehydrogenase
MIRWGVVGACGIADRRTIPEGIMPAENAELVAVMDVVPDKLEAIAKKHDAKPYVDSSELYADPDIDAVYIAIPTHLHCQEALKAAAAGKHVLCEKPMAMTLSEAERMIEACRRAKVKLGVGFMMRFHPLHVKLKEMVSAGQLGKLVMGRSQLTCWYPPIPGAWRQNPELGGGGSFIDMGTHCIDVLEMFMGKVARVHAFTNRLVQGYPVEDTALISVMFRSGAVGLVDNHFNVPDEAMLNVLELYGSKGSVMAEGTIGQMSTGKMIARIQAEAKGYAAAQQRTAIQPEEVNGDPRNIYQAEIEEFSRAIEEDKSPPVPGEDGLWNLRIALAAYKSARSGQVIELA